MSTTWIPAVAIIVGGLISQQSLPAQDKKLLARIEALEKQVAEQNARLQNLDDIEKINKLTRAYGYYVDKNLWDQVVDLFADDCSVEIAARGVYLGKKGADRLFRGAFGGGKIGLQPGRLFNHFQLQGIVDVDPGGLTADGRWRVFAQIATIGRSAVWSEGIYEDVYTKEEGVWKFKKMKFWPTYYTPFDEGWAKKNLPNNGPSKEYPPDRPPTDNAGVFPDLNMIPPFHYKNPVTGK